MTRKRLKVSAELPHEGAAPSLACYFPSGGQQTHQKQSYSVYETKTGRAPAYTVIGRQVTQKDGTFCQKGTRCMHLQYSLPLKITGER